MNCWHCDNPLIWGGDIDTELGDQEMIETNLSCSKCEAFVLVYLPVGDISDDQQKTQDDMG